MTNAKIRVERRGQAAEELELAPGVYRIGREAADIVLADENVSARHAELQVKLGEVVISDSGSRNGTFDPLGRRLSGPYSMAPNDSVRLGETRLTWVRQLGHAGGTRVVPETPAAGGTRVMPEAPTPAAAPAPSAAPTRPSRDETGSLWGKLVGGALIGLVAVAGLKALGAALAKATPPDCYVVGQVEMEPATTMGNQLDFGINVAATLENRGAAGTVEARAVVQTADGTFEQTQSVHVAANQQRRVTFSFQDPTFAGSLIHSSSRVTCSP